MKTKIVSQLLPFVAMLAIIASCGGSSSGTSGSSDSGDGTVSEVTSISDIPTSVIDPSQYDISTNTSLQASLSKSIEKAAGVGAFSRAGCETDRMKKNIIRNALLPKMILCMMGAMDTASGNTFAGDGVFKYWKAPDEMGENGPSGVDSFKPRMAVKRNTTDLTFVVCNDTVKAMEFYISWANDVYSGQVVDKWGDGFQSKLQFSADGLPTTTAGDVGFTTATFIQDMIEASSWWSGFASQTLEATPTYNVVRGFYNEEGDNSYAGSVYAKFNNTQGTARYKQDSAGSYPAMSVQDVFDSCEVQSGTGNCGDLDTDWLGAEGWFTTQCTGIGGATANSYICFPNTCVENAVCCPTLAAQGGTCTSAAGEDHQESFTITLTDSVNHVLTFGIAPSSIYADDVAAVTMPSSSAAPTIEFTSYSADVDCTASAGWTSMESVFTSEPNMSDCNNIQAELDDWDTGDLCQILDSAASGSNYQ